MTPKQQVKQKQPGAILDFYELLRQQGKPCWFIRYSQCGYQLSAICPTPRAAWQDALSRIVQREAKFKAHKERWSGARAAEASTEKLAVELFNL
jgi:hypothetical protein